jgi:hypothetical protein
VAVLCPPAAVKVANLVAALPKLTDEFPERDTEDNVDGKEKSESTRLTPLSTMSCPLTMEVPAGLFDPGVRFDLLELEGVGITGLCFDNKGGKEKNINYFEPIP